MTDINILPRVWTDKGYYYPIFSELGVTYENPKLPFDEKNVKPLHWAFRWSFDPVTGGDIYFDNILERPTGLRDKNNKLIYEGDIVTDGFNTFVVEWYSEMAQFVARFRDEKQIYTLFYPDDAETKYEVLGNIHEGKKRHAK